MKNTRNIRAEVKCGNGRDDRNGRDDANGRDDVNERSGGYGDTEGGDAFNTAKARNLLLNYPRLLRRKTQQELRMKTTPRFTKEDALYSLCGARAVNYDGIHIQSSYLPDPTANAAINVDHVLEQMNREAMSAASRGYKKLVNDINTVRMAYSDMDPDTALVAWQIFSERISYKQVINTAGETVRYAGLKNMENKAVEAVEAVLEWEAENE